MPKYIDADELWIQLDKRESFEQGRNRAYHKGLRDAKKILNEQPTADVVERKKGKWIDDGKGLYMCSSCGKLWVYWWARVVPLNQMCKELRYCPMCGADMGEENENEKVK